MNRSDLVEAARIELRTREVHYPQQVAQKKRPPDEAGRTIAAWRAVVELLHRGNATFEPCLGETPALAWAQIVSAVHAAATHRLNRALTDGSDEAVRQSAALRQIRSLVLRSAIRAGAELPSFDGPEHCKQEIAA